MSLLRGVRRRIKRQVQKQNGKKPEEKYPKENQNSVRIDPGTKFPHRPLLAEKRLRPEYAFRRDGGPSQGYGANVSGTWKKPTTKTTTEKEKSYQYSCMVLGNH